MLFKPRFTFDDKDVSLLEWISNHSNGFDGEIADFIATRLASSNKLFSEIMKENPFMILSLKMLGDNVIPFIEGDFVTFIQDGDRRSGFVERVSRGYAYPILVQPIDGGEPTSFKVIDLRFANLPQSFIKIFGKFTKE